MEEAAYFFISTEVAKEVKEDTINEVYKELNLLMTELVPDDELQRVKNYLLGDFLRQADGPMAMLENFKNIHFNNLRPSYYSDFIQAIHNLKAEDVMDLAKKYLQKNDLTVVTVG
jgi:predicted Zn-dependent peptidase